MNSVPLWLIIVAEKLTLAVYGSKPQSRRAHGGRTDGDDYPGSSWVGFLRLDGKEC